MISIRSPLATPRFSTSGCSPASTARRRWPVPAAGRNGSSRIWPRSRGSRDAPGERYQVAARLARRVVERAVRGPAELQAVAGGEFVLDRAFPEVQPALEQPDLLLGERVRVGGE